MRPRIKPVYVLIHSPLVSEFTWMLVADELRRHSEIVLLPSLRDVPDSNQPYWQQHAASVAQALSKVPRAIPFILVAHSGAGPLLPVIRQQIPNRVQAYVFVDAGIPRDGATRLDLMVGEDPAWAGEFQIYLEGGGRFPNWVSEDLEAILPDKTIRKKLIAEVSPRGLDFFTEPIPVFPGWPDANCIYIQYSAAYRSPAEYARANGWITRKIEAGHFEMLVHPQLVTELLEDLVHESVSR